MADQVTTYHVVVTREGDHWLADVPSVPGAHTFSRTLSRLDAEVREVIAVVLDLSRSEEAELTLDYEYHTGDDEADEEASRLRVRRAELDLANADLARQTEEVARKLTQLVPVRDAAVLLRVSPGRISQIAPATKAKTGVARAGG